MSVRVSELLDEGVARGIISPEQRDQLLRLSGQTPDRASGRTGEFLAWARETPRGFNAITLAYGVGAFAVVFALGWFLADRWTDIGERGVLVVSVVYAGVFSLAARVFGRERFPTAHGVAAALLILTVPLIVWSFLHVTGVWQTGTGSVCQLAGSSFWDCRAHPTVLAASVVAATLVVLRRLRFGPLMIPGAAGLAVVLVGVALEVSRSPGGIVLVGWSFTFAASVLAMIAYETDRRQRTEDYGRWLHLAAAICAGIALADLFNSEPGARHLLLPTALMAMASSLFLRRIVWLVVGLGALFSYLTWLATEVFERAVAFPVILAMVGLTVIVVTVWVQRSYPRLAARVRESDGRTPRMPGGAAILLAPALVAVLLMPVTREARVRAVEAREAAQQAASDAAARTARERTRPQTPPAPPPSRPAGDSTVR